MAEDIKRTVFSFGEEESEAAARCEVGTGDLPERASFWMVLVILLTIGARIMMDLPLPSLQMTGMYAAALLMWVLFLIYIKFRLRKTAEDLRKRELVLITSGEGFAVYEFSTDLRYHTAFSEITSVERGDHVYRITSPMGRICLPVRKLPAEFRDRLEQLPDAAHTARRWM